MAAITTGGSLTRAILRIVEPPIFHYRRIMLAVLLLITAFLGWQASHLQPQASWLKMVPQEHPYMQTFLEYYQDFGGANTVLVALHNEKGSIYQPEFMEALRQATDEVFLTPGVDRARVTSIFTPNILYVEVIEGGLAGETVVPSNYQPTPAMMERIRTNVGKANVIGRLVSEDASTALIVAELLEHDPITNERLDLVKVGDTLEQIRAQFERPGEMTVHIIGFAKVVDDMTDASLEVASFFVLSLLLTGALLWGYVGNLRLAALVLIVSGIACVWELGLLALVGYGLDPFAILVPFLILSVSVSHGVQYVNAWAHEIYARGADSYQASLATFRALAIPGVTALITDVAGFLTIYLINIDVIREMSLNAAFGMAAVIITNKVMMPEVLSFLKLRDVEAFRRAQERREQYGDAVFRLLARITRRGPAIAVLAVCAGLLGGSLYLYPQLRVGETTEGVPELRPDSRFNQDARMIAAHFALGVDQLKVIAETFDDSCIHYDAIAEIDRFNWYMLNQPGVRDVMSLLDLSKLAYSGLNEGRLNAETLPRAPQSLAQSTALVPTTTGLLNDDCDALALFIFTADHKAETITALTDAVKKYEAEMNQMKCPEDRTEDTRCVEFRLASGNVGVMAATNEEVVRNEIAVVGWVYVVILVFLWLSFRTLSGVVCIVVPLSLVTMMGYAVMVLMDIGQKVATLPVLALATGIGVDYGIYIYSVLAAGLRLGKPLEQAYYETLRQTGKAVLFTGLALGVSVITWLLSKLQFQADMGLILVFAFTANMLGAILVLPALAHFFWKEELRHAGQDLTLDADSAVSEKR